jgi:hypothetical protein
MAAAVARGLPLLDFPESPIILFASTGFAERLPTSSSLVPSHKFMKDSCTINLI